MTTTEIKNRIEYLARERFYLACKDRWLARDWDEDRKLSREIRELEARLEKGEE